MPSQPSMKQNEAVDMARKMLEAQRMANPSQSADYIRREIDNSVKQMRKVEAASQQVAATLMSDTKKLLAAKVKEAKRMNPKLAPYLDSVYQTSMDISPATFENYTLEYEVRNNTLGTVIHATRKTFVNAVYPSCVYNVQVGKVFVPTNDAVHGAQVDRYARFLRTNKGTQVTFDEFMDEPDNYEQMVANTLESIISTPSCSTHTGTGMTTTKYGTLSVDAIVATELSGSKQVVSLAAFSSFNTTMGRSVKPDATYKLYIPLKGRITETIFEKDCPNGYYAGAGQIIYNLDGFTFLPVTSTDGRTLYLYQLSGIPVTDDTTLTDAMKSLG